MPARKSGQCIVGGCPNEATNKLGVRLRENDRRAVWTVESGALVCDAHAQQGAFISLDLTPRADAAEIDVTTRGFNPDPAQKTTEHYFRTVRRSDYRNRAAR